MARTVNDIARDLLDGAKAAQCSLVTVKSTDIIAVASALLGEPHDNGEQQRQPEPELPATVGDGD